MTVTKTFFITDEPVYLVGDQILAHDDMGEEGIHHDDWPDYSANDMEVTITYEIEYERGSRDSYGAPLEPDYSSEEMIDVEVSEDGEYFDTSSAVDKILEEAAKNLGYDD